MIDSTVENKPLTGVDTHAPLLTVEHLTVRYSDETALEDVSFTVDAGDQIAIIGPNGAGKSTLIRAIMGLLTPDGGTVQRANPNAPIGYVAQHEAVNWNFPVEVRDVVLMGMARQVGWFRLPGRNERARADEALRRVDMLSFAHRTVDELSGGQRRRVFIARALAQNYASSQNTGILILDEPFSGVDARAQAELMDVLDRLNGEGLTVLLSTHDLDLAFHRFKKVMALRKRLIAYGEPNAVYHAEVLADLYGKRVMAWREGESMAIFVDEHGCGDC